MCAGGWCGRTLTDMSEARAMTLIGSLIWFFGGVGLVAALISGWTLFAPFALPFVALGAWATVYGVVLLLRG